MDANNGGQSWRKALGSQIRDARKAAGLSQEGLGSAVKLSRKMIGRYEAGTDAPSVHLLGKIALELGLRELDINGYKFEIASRPEAVGPPVGEQLRLDFGQEYASSQVKLSISPGRASITITAIIATPSLRAAQPSAGAQ